MPGLDGYEVARRIREEMGSTAPFLVAVTGYGQERDRRRASRAGFDVHLVKPATAERLREALQEVDHGASERASGS
jgi:CheY-like chemotaxis protein